VIRRQAIVLLALVGLLAARWVARGVLAPVNAAARAAERIEHGDLSARVPVASRDEFGAWAASFNEMAEALEAKINALSEAQARERRFTADVAHEQAMNDLGDQIASQDHRCHVH